MSDEMATDYRAQLYLMAAYYWFDEAQHMYVHRDAAPQYGWERALRNRIKKGATLLSRVPTGDIPEIALVLSWDIAMMRSPVRDGLGDEDTEDPLYTWNASWWTDLCMAQMTDETQGLISLEIGRKQE